MTAIRTINGTAPPIEPLTYRLTKSDLYSDSTGRSSETGKLLAYVIRRNVYTIELEYQGSDAEIGTLERLIDDSRLTVVFLENGDYVTKIMYPSDREKETEKIMNGIGRHRLSFSLIEY